MPPKLQPKEDRKTLVSKMQNTNRSLDELLEEFEVIYAAKPQLARLQTIFAEHSKTSFEKNCFSAWASTLNMGLINKVDMVCLSPLGYGV